MKSTPTKEQEMDRTETVAALEALAPGESFSVNGGLTATRREDGQFDIDQSGIPIGGARNADLCATSINPALRPKSTPEQRAQWAAERAAH